MLTSNLVFSQWEQIFKDPMTTAAAIDRLVHHSVILELNMPSFRMEQAKAAQEAAGQTKAAQEAAGQTKAAQEAGQAAQEAGQAAQGAGQA